MLFVASTKQPDARPRNAVLPGRWVDVFLLSRYDGRVGRFHDTLRTFVHVAVIRLGALHDQADGHPLARAASRDHVVSSARKFLGRKSSRDSIGVRPDGRA